MGNAGSVPEQAKNSADGGSFADAEARRAPPSMVRFFPEAERQKARQPPPIKLEEEEGAPPLPTTEEEMAPPNLWQVSRRLHSSFTSQVTSRGGALGRRKTAAEEGVVPATPFLLPQAAPAPVRPLLPAVPDPDPSAPFRFLFLSAREGAGVTKRYARGWEMANSSQYGARGVGIAGALPQARHKVDRIGEAIPRANAQDVQTSELVDIRFQCRFSASIQTSKRSVRFILT
ncbi:hypothetical protein BAE44_0008507 [Dichanthelium oligosanthes]|uniref:Uncharacterized protein n=1 Tax=Dichanthelium oligosanthes TaxID=888268 RepID=A0A1E5VZA6_9POAL|nr:hypothetical protein BAE44_0008507 [Dichanthelium oligosanthes]